MNRIIIVLLLPIILFSCKKPDPEKINYDWKDYSLNSDIDLQKIQMLDDKIGYIGAGNYYLEVEGNSVETFTFNADILNSDSLILNPDPDLFWYGYECNTDNFHPVLYKTLDGGKSWQPIKTPFKIQVNSLQFLNEQVGYVVTEYDGLYKTIDGGINWQQIIAPKIHLYYLRFAIDPIDDIIFINENIGFAYDNNGGAYDLVLKTTDGGNSWDCINLKYHEPYDENQVQPTVFEGRVENMYYEKYKGDIYVQTTSKIYKSEDEGTSWHEFFSFESSDSELFFYGSENIYMPNLMLKSHDGGTSWEQFNMYDVAFGNFVAVAATKYYYAEDGGVYYGENNNLPHEHIKLTMETKVANINMVFPSENLGIIVGSKGAILRYEP